MSAVESDPIFIPKTVNIANFQKDSIEILNVVRPKWIEDWNLNGVEIRSMILSGGFTNKLYAFFSSENPEAKDIVIIKVYGQNTEKMIDRKREITAMKILAHYKCGPEIYATFENGQCFEFLPGEVLNVETVRSPQVYPLVARKLAKFHKAIPLEGTITSEIWVKMRQFHNLLKDSPKLPLLERDQGITYESAEEGIDKLESLLERQNIPVAFCHNDLILGNIIYYEPKNKVTFIDFEYAMPNYIAFDLANHFNEFAGIDPPDFTKRPDSDLRRKWIEIYLQEYFGGSVCREEWPFTVEVFEKWVKLCTPVSYLFWALWAAVQANESDIKFDYISYAGLLYSQYKRHMKKIEMNPLQVQEEASIIPLILVLILCLIIFCFVKFRSIS